MILSSRSKLALRLMAKTTGVMIVQTIVGLGLCVVFLAFFASAFLANAYTFGEIWRMARDLVTDGGLSQSLWVVVPAVVNLVLVQGVFWYLFQRNIRRPLSLSPRKCTLDDWVWGLPDPEATLSSSGGKALLMVVCMWWYLANAFVLVAATAVPVLVIMGRFVWSASQQYRKNRPAQVAPTHGTWGKRWKTWWDRRTEKTLNAHPAERAKWEAQELAKACKAEPVYESAPRSRL